MNKNKSKIVPVIENTLNNENESSLSCLNDSEKNSKLWSKEPEILSKTNFFSK